MPSPLRKKLCCPVRDNIFFILNYLSKTPRNKYKKLYTVYNFWGWIQDWNKKRGVGGLGLVPKIFLIYLGWIRGVFKEFGLKRVCAKWVDSKPDTIIPRPARVI